MERMETNYKMKSGRKIVYWGCGSICKRCLEQHTDIQPVFLIDSHTEHKILFDRPVKRPTEIEDWSFYYIIITIKSDIETEKIRNNLEQNGLKEGRDFSTYKEVFRCEVPSVCESIEQIRSYMNRHTETVRPILLMLPFELIRDSKNFVSFIVNYIQARGVSNCLIFSWLSVMSAEEASGRFQCRVFCLSNDFEDRRENERLPEKLSEEERDWLRELEKRKTSSDPEKSINKYENLYQYYKNIFAIVHPSKLIYWGNWSRESYIVGYLAKIYGIPCGYMEHGWLPGTYQVDRGGVMGQSEYAVNPLLFETIAVEEIYDIEQIKEFIREQKLDTRKFIETSEDNDALQKIEKGKKTIFLVGMDDDGMQMNPESDYWRTRISGVVSSTGQALQMLIEICRKNDWNLIFKPHPGNPVSQTAREEGIVTLVRETEIDRLIKLADVVVSIASAVDYKTLIYEKPLVQLGINGLKGKGCSYTVSRKSELEDSIMLALKVGMTCSQKEKFNRLLQILLQKYLWDDMTERKLRYGLGVERDFLDG